MNCDPKIERYGKALTVVRSPTVATYGIIRPNTGKDIQDRSNFFDAFLKYASALVPGEQVLDGTTYYLTAQADNVMKGAAGLYIKALLLKCNASVTISKLSSGSWTTVTSAVKCLITKAALRIPNDEAAYRERVRGSQDINYVYMAATQELYGGYSIADGTKTLKVLDSISPYLGSGIVEAQAILE